MEKHGDMAREIALAALFACFLSCTLLVRQNPTTAPLLSHYTSRLVQIAVLFLVALVARRSIIKPVVLFKLGAGALAVQILLEIGFSFLPVALQSEHLIALRGCASFFNGAALGMTTLLFARMLCEVPTRHVLVIIPLAWAASHLMFFFLPLSPATLLGPPSTPLLLLSLAGLAALARTSTVSAPLVAPFRTPRKEPLQLLPLLKSSRYFLVYFGALLFPFLYGLMAQICSDASISSGLFDLSTEIIGILFLVLLAASAPLQRNRLDAEGVFIVALPIFATALLFLPLFWGREVFVSGFIMKCGFAGYSVMLWIQLQRLSHPAPDRSFFLAGVALGLYHTALLTGRFCAFALNARAALSDQAIAMVALLAIWLLSLAALIALLSHRRHGEKTALTTSQPISFEEAHRQLAALYGLSERESLVSREFARGHTVAHIAEELVVSQETVKTHLKRTYAKTDCHSRQDLIDRIDALGRQQTS